jgi:hypothetical protein
MVVFYSSSLSNQQPIEQIQETAPAQEVAAEAPKAEQAVEAEASTAENNAESAAEQVVDKVDAAAPETVKKTSWYKKALGGVKKLVKSVNK